MPQVFENEEQLEEWCKILDAHYTNEPVHIKRVFTAYANSEGSGEPARPHSLARVFTVRSHNIGS